MDTNITTNQTISIGTLKYIIKKRTFIQELYTDTINPSTVLRCGVCASTLAFNILKYKERKKKYIHIK
jgi:hypothetical protein